jgi:hypothetical protein
LCHRAFWFYLYLAEVSVPLLGIVETPEISGARSIVHFFLFLLCSYFGFRRPVTLTHSIK